MADQKVSRNVKVLSVSIITAAALVAGGIAYAAGDTITACVNKSTGLTRIISGKMKCYKRERPVSWNQSGPAGAQGATGATGSSGTSSGYYKLPLDGSNVGIQPNSYATVFSATLPSGKYVFNFSTKVRFFTNNLATTGAKYATCALSTESVALNALSSPYASSYLWPVAGQALINNVGFAEVAVNEESSSTIFSGDGILNLDATTTFYFQCKYASDNADDLTGSEMIFSFPSFTAIKVDTLTDVSIAPS